jgi:glycosyltransferase involved in cell wall biosynthesis
MKVLVAVTAYNEEKNIGSVIERMPTEYDVLVVDDGSSDRTVEIARGLGAMVAVHPLNLGQGPAFITSIKICTSMDYDVFVQIDGDGQHNPQEIPKFIEVLENTDFDIVVGSRLTGKDYKNAPFLRKTFLPYFTYAINKITGYNMTDSMCGLRAYRVTSLRKVVKELERMFEPQYLAAEMFIRVAHAGFTVTEVPIELKERLSGKSRKGTFRYGWGVSRAILKTFLEKKVTKKKQVD